MLNSMNPPKSLLAVSKICDRAYTSVSTFEWKDGRAQLRLEGVDNRLCLTVEAKLA